jgi:modulator of FtsH protease
MTVWEAGGATALFVPGFGAAGYATRRDLSMLARSFYRALQVSLASTVATLVAGC